jgi:hypothetical protein
LQYWREHNQVGHTFPQSLPHLSVHGIFNPLKPELNPSVQRCLTRFVTGDFASLTVYFINTCVKNQQIHQLYIVY